MLHDFGPRELWRALGGSSGALFGVVVFGIFANLLMLTAPLYMLQVYDRVLTSRSVETLVALSLLAGFFYLLMGVLDHARGRIMARVGAHFQRALDRRVFEAMLRKSAVRKDHPPVVGLRDLEAVQRLLGSPVVLAIIDLPWTPIFLFGIFVFHPWLGTLAFCGGAVLVFLAVLNQWLSRRLLSFANSATLDADLMADAIRAEAEMIQSMGMQRAVFDRWHLRRTDALCLSVAANDRGGIFANATKIMRLVLQSAMLGFGAWLVLRGELSPGGMIASSILMGRALVPVELVVGQWPIVQRGLKGWQMLGLLLSQVPPHPVKTPLPRPLARLDVRALTVVPPGQSMGALRGLGFALAPGIAIGVIGPSGSGKTTLARALTGVWRPAGGHIRLDGATLDQYDPETLGKYIGYLPQRVHLFDGTIAENIARFDPTAKTDDIITAARRAAAHDLILSLPKGYDTRMSPHGAQLSGGQLQRIGLARALYGDPVIVILDEPNSNLDNEGSIALNATVRWLKSEGRGVLIMAHRPAAIQECDHLLMLENGICTAFGPKDRVLRDMVKNASDIARLRGFGGVQ